MVPLSRGLRTTCTMGNANARLAAALYRPKRHFLQSPAAGDRTRGASEDTRGGETVFPASRDTRRARCTDGLPFDSVTAAVSEQGYFHPLLPTASPVLQTLAMSAPQSGDSLALCRNQGTGRGRGRKWGAAVLNSLSKKPLHSRQMVRV